MISNLTLAFILGSIVVIIIGLIFGSENVIAIMIFSLAFFVICMIFDYVDVDKDDNIIN